MANIIDLNDAKEQGTITQHTLYVDCSKAIDEFIREIAGKGLGATDIVPDGQIHRFTTANDKHGSKSGWYVFYADSVPSGAYGSWKEDVNETYVYKQGSYSRESQEIIRQRIEQTKWLRHEERLKVNDETASEAVKLWESASPVIDHQYLKTKGVQSFGLKVTQKTLLVPMLNDRFEIRNIQRITADGKKFFLKGGEKSSCFYSINGNMATVFICEGYATGASLFMATGNTVFVAFDAGNLSHVAKLVKKNLPMASIVIAADNDQFTYINNVPTNVGLEKAYAAAQEINANVVYPIFKKTETKPTDFNDLFLLEGLEAVKYQTYISNDGPNLFNWGVSLFEDKAPSVKWLVKDFIPSAAPCMLTAQGGTGKGMLSLDLALSIAEQKNMLDLNPKAWLGKEVMESGVAVIFSAEDSQTSIHQRLEQLDPTGERRKRAKNRLYTVPLPNAGGPVQFVVSQGYGKGYKTTPAFENVRKQLKSISNLKFINFDPLASFVGVDINADPQAGAFVQGMLANLAEELQATVLVSHHMSKPQKGGIKSIEDARNAIRGTSALVDGVRLVLAVWNASDDAKKKVKALNEKVRMQDIFECAVVKSNNRADNEVKTLVRSENGLLVPVKTKPVELNTKTLEDLIIEAVAQRASVGQPFTKSGQAGLYARREELHEELRTIAKHKLENLVQSVLESGRIVGVTYKSSLAKYLDVPGGGFAEGNVKIEHGYVLGRPKKE